MRALILAVALVACTQPAPTLEAAPEAGAQDALAAMPSWDGARAAGVDFRAIGQEPGWMLDIYQRDQIKLIWDYGENSTTFPLAAANTAREGVTSYATQADGRTLAVTIQRTPCQDAMSGETYPATVEVVIDGRALNGCGMSV